MTYEANGPEVREGIDLSGEYWQAYKALMERQAREKEELYDRHFREAISLHLDFPDDPGAVAFLDGVRMKAEGVEIVEEIRREKAEQ
jgi:FMN phosphatase YigB (HAD superfamily)